MTENTAACIQCGAIASPGTQYCETCGAPVMSASAPLDDAEPSDAPVRVFDSYGPSGARTADVSAVVTGEVWVSEPTVVAGAASAGIPASAGTPDDPAPPKAVPAAPAGTPAGGDPASAPIIIGAPSAASAKPRGSGISAAIPTAANARLALDRSAAADHAADGPASDRSRSYREQYAATQFAVPPAVAPGSVAPAPTGPLTAAENEPPWRQIGCLRVITVILGLNWLVPGVIGLVADAILLRGGAPFGEVLPADVISHSQAAITGVGVVHLAWILVGIKILVAPGRWSLAITGLAFIVGAIGILFLLSLVRDPAPSVIAGVAAVVLVEVVLGLMAITAAQSIE